MYVLSFFVDKRYDIEVYTGFFVERDDKVKVLNHPSLHLFIVKNHVVLLLLLFVFK